MPHVIVKLWPGKPEQQKTRLAEAIAKDVMEVLHYGEESVSVAMEEVKSQDWRRKCTNLTFKTSGTGSTKSPGTM
jgi:4-oxalocrotonate tautomerase